MNGSSVLQWSLPICQRVYFPVLKTEQGEGFGSCTNPVDGVKHDEIQRVPTELPVYDGQRVAGCQAHNQRPSL